MRPHGYAWTHSMWPHSRKSHSYKGMHTRVHMPTCMQGSTCLRRLSYTGPHSYKPFIREATFLQWQALPPILLQHLRQGRSGGSEMQKDALRQMLSDTDVEIIWTSRHRPLAIVRMLAAIVQVPLSRCPAPGPALRGGKWSHSSTMPCRLAAAALRKSALVLSLSLLLASEQALVCSGPLGRRCASAACICLHVTHRLHLTHGLMPLRCRTRTRNECCSGTARSLTQVGACLWCLSLVLVFGACRAFRLPLPARAVGCRLCARVPRRLRAHVLVAQALASCLTLALACVQGPT